ncbi:hypothetical protein Tco_0787229 [Tanacetum coccineum]
MPISLPPPLGIALGPAYEVEESSSAAARPARGLRTDYGFVATTDRRSQPRSGERDVRYGITDSWDEIVKTLQGAPVSTDTVVGSTYDIRIGHAHAPTARLRRLRARILKAWGRSIDASDLARAEVMSLRTTVLAQQSQIREFQSADCRR